MLKTHRRYSQSVLGGTFDHLHKGHESFLRFALERSKKIILGLADRALLENKTYRSVLQTYEERKQALETFFRHENRENDVIITPLFDHYGVTDQFPLLEALFVTPLTLVGAEAVHRMRKEIFLRPLLCECAEMVRDQHGEYLSSTRIRSGQVARDGFVYLSLFSEENKRLVLHMRKELEKPWGSVLRGVPSISGTNLTVLIGDITTKHFLDHNLPFSFAYVDGKTRQVEKIPYDPDAILETELTNPAGSFSRPVVHHMIDQATQDNHKKVFLIHGEEDTLVTPAVLCLPLGTNVIYGDPRRHCMRDIVVTEEIKGTLRILLQ